MSNPDNAAAQTASENTELTFEQQVNEVVQNFVETEDGTFKLPDDVTTTPEVKYAAVLEKRRRDTQSALGKTRQQLIAEETLRKQLEQRVEGQTKVQLTPEKAAELETLKFEDPEAWRTKMNELDQQATTAFREELSTMSAQALQQAELSRRTQVLEAFNTLHSDAQISDDVIANDIPPRMTKKLETGQITFEEFLTEAHKYLTAPRKVATNTKQASPKLGDAAGNAVPSDSARQAQQENSYANEIY